MIIDCHGHYTTAPAAHTAWREAQRAAFEANQATPAYPTISDDEIRESVETNQLRLMAERGIDLTVFSPRASAMGHHIGDESVSTRWAQVCNDLIARVGATCTPSTSSGLPAPAVPRRPDRPLGRRAAPLRRGARFRRLQPQPRPERRPLDLPTAHRPQLVPALRGDGRARRAGDDPRRGRATRTSTPPGPTTSTPTPRPSCSCCRRTCSGLPRAAAGHPARRRRRAVPLGPVPRARRHARAGRHRRTRSWTTSSSTPASTTSRASTCSRGHPAPTTSCSRSEMVGAVRGIDPETGHHFDDTRRYVEALDLTPRRPHRDLRGQRPPRVPTTAHRPRGQDPARRPRLS